MATEPHVEPVETEPAAVPGDSGAVDPAPDETADGNSATAEDDRIPDITERARQLGWKDRDEYRGDPRHWRDAEEYIRVAEQETPILRENFRRLSATVAELERELKAQRAFTETALEAERKRVIAEYEARQREAVRNGDEEEWERLERQKKEAASLPEVKIEESTPPAVSEAIRRFELENDWYGTNAAMTDFAKAESDRIAQVLPHLDPEAHLRKVALRVREEFPQWFERRSRSTAKHEGAAPVEKTRRPPPAKGKKTYENMPAEYRHACDVAVRRGMCSREDYVKVYYAQQEAGK